MICIVSLFLAFSPAEFSEVIISSYLNKDVQSNFVLVALFSGYLIANINANCLLLVMKSIGKFIAWIHKF